MLLGALILHLVVIMMMGDQGYYWDIVTLQRWATRLHTAPLMSFYADPQFPSDHLPGDMWVLWIITWLYMHAVPNASLWETGFVVALKLVPTAANLGIGFVLYHITARIGDTSSSVAVLRRYLFNPGPVFVAAVWGQWDGLSTLLALVGLWLMLGKHPQWAFPFLVEAVLIKPLFISFIPIFGLAWIYRLMLETDGVSPWWKQWSLIIRRHWSKIVVALVSSTCVGLATIVPFNVGVPPLELRWSLVERVQFAANHFTDTSRNAFNLWATPLAGNRLPDNHVFVFGASYVEWGFMLYMIVVVTAVVFLVRRLSPLALIWACAALSLGSFTMLTRMHERYLFPAIAFLALLSTRDRVFAVLYAAISLLFCVNLVYAFAEQESSSQLDGLFEVPGFVAVMSVLMTAGVVLFFVASPVLLAKHAARWDEQEFRAV